MTKKKVIETKSGVKVHLLDSADELKNFKDSPFAIPVEVDVDENGKVKLNTTMQMLPTELVEVIVEKSAVQASDKVYRAMRHYKRWEILGWKVCAIFELVSIVVMAIINFWR